MTGQAACAVDKKEQFMCQRVVCGGKGSIQKTFLNSLSLHHFFCGVISKCSLNVCGVSLVVCFCAGSLAEWHTVSVHTVKTARGNNVDTRSKRQIAKGLDQYEISVIQCTGTSEPRHINLLDNALHYLHYQLLLPLFPEGHWKDGGTLETIGRWSFVAVWNPDLQK